eukprot:CAMPEP_0114498094 /NCGR_PEP_ID=MMETSP0109-20121206/6689_1 /TAXON_ID=29199 /ORGANISM="Chlorarachnion reptans, Strain CCCM449" /LENGTH=507 /DNA_ID=CAMNT_0001675549 /DNA_START=52 /DNA_END=1572 /DNA_ORIENTATION=+
MASQGAQVEVEAHDVIKLIIQFLKENSLLNTVRTLQEESQVTLNTVENVDNFMNDILHGRWDSVIEVVSTLRLPNMKLMELFEQIVLELAEMRELDTARALLRLTPAMHTMKREAPDRYLRLEHILQRTYFDYNEAYPQGTNKERRRQHIAASLKDEVYTVPPSRLLSIISQSLKWQQYLGRLPPGSKYDLFRGKAPTQQQEADAVPKKNIRVIKFGKKSKPNCAAFSPDGQYLVSGSSDGFVEVWNFDTGKLNKSLQYQAEDDIMMHSEAVISVTWSRDSELIATGTAKGQVKIWRVLTGSCVRTFASAHSGGVTSLDFARDSTQLLTSSFDNTLRIHGLKSGRKLKEFRGHTSFVNSAVYSSDFSKVLSGSSDGTIRIWDAKTTECLKVFTPKEQTSVLKVKRFAKHADRVMLCLRSPNLEMYSLIGKKVKSFEAKSDMVDVAFSPRSKLIYAVGEDQVLYCWNSEDDALEDAVRLHAKEVLGIAHHPHRNILASFSVDGTMKIW